MTTCWCQPKTEIANGCSTSTQSGSRVRRYGGLNHVRGPQLLPCHKAPQMKSKPMFRGSSLRQPMTNTYAKEWSRKELLKGRVGRKSRPEPKRNSVVDDGAPARNRRENIEHRSPETSLYVDVVIWALKNPKGSHPKGSFETTVKP